MSELEESPDDFADFGSGSDGITDAHLKAQEPGYKPNSVEEQDHDKAPMAGRLTQYAYHGAGFVGTTKTRATVPTGTYKIEFDQRVGFSLQPLPITTDNLYRLPDTKSDEVIDEIKRFWTLGAKFREFGFIHKRGILLYGPPGSGKTSTISMATAQMLEMGGIVIFADVPAAISSILYQVRQIEPDRPVIVIIEDIDTVIHRHGESEVLAILDGEMSVDNIVFLATTNYPEKLDGRVVNRPSRFDKVVKIGMPNAEARELYLTKKGISKADVETWVGLSEGFSIAHLKEMLVCVLCFGDNLDDVATRLHKMMAKAPKSDSSDTEMGFGKNASPARRTGFNK